MMKYDGIINMPHHRSKKHPHMPVEVRAAQFSPFAALTGHGEAIKETERITDRKIELDEYEIAVIDAKLQEIRDRLREQLQITVTYFLKDNRKAGGEYKTISGNVKKIDEHTKCLIMKDGMRIAIEDILELVLN